MMKKVIGFIVVLGAVYAGLTDSFAAKTQSVISKSSQVRAKIDATGIYDQKCYDSYYGCMDQFCIVDNEIGGSCNCSDDIKKYKSTLDEIKQTLATAQRIATEEVEKVQAGANADIIFQGSRQYDEKGNVIAVKATKDKKEIDKSLWTSSLYDEEDEEDEDQEENVAKIGTELYNEAHKICKSQIDSSCDKDMTILTQMYLRGVVADCKGLANGLEQKKSEAKIALAEANKAVRSALRESLEEANKYDRGTCLVEYRNCMKGEEACGSDWENCVFAVAAENMQNNEAVSVAGTKVKTIRTYSITPATMEILESKRFICDKILDNCVAVRDLIWDDFLHEAAPTIRIAELNIESQKRQSCLGDISACIQKACKDDIAGTGEATMDACLARPDIARSFCKVQIDPCERMEPKIWDYVVAKLSALRVDACTKQVKDCIIDICGKDHSQCIGMDTGTIGDMCPEEKLVACMKDGDIDTVRDYVAQVAQGIALQIDNDLAKVCQAALDEAMLRVCGDLEECKDFVLEDDSGSHSFKYQVCKYDGFDGKNIHWTSDCRESAAGIADQDVEQPEGKGWAGKLSGIIYWGDIQYRKDRSGKYGFTTIEEYMDMLTEAGQKLSAEDKKIISELVYGTEMRALENSIQQTVSAIESDPNVTYCMTGRKVQGFDGKKFGKIGKKNGRFPNLTQNVRDIISFNALKVARQNYLQKYESEMERMMTDEKKLARVLNLNVAAEICRDWAQKSTLPASPTPKVSNVGKWIAVGVIAAAAIVASVFTAGAAGVAGFAAIGGIVGTGTAATLAFGTIAVGTALIGAKMAKSIEPVGKAEVNQWNYKMNVTTMLDRTTGECIKYTVTQDCKKVKRNYCEYWNEPQEKKTVMKLVDSVEDDKTEEEKEVKEEKKEDKKVKKVSRN